MKKEISLDNYRRVPTGELIAAADRSRAETAGDTVTWVKNRNINFTNVCEVKCRFCAFGRQPGSEGGYLHEREEISRKVDEGCLEGISEVCIQGGINPGLDLKYYSSLLREIKNRHPEVHIHAFSPMEIHSLSKRENKSYEHVIRALIDCGLGSIPGTAAEILDDEVRKKLCPGKLSTKEWIEVIKTAHSLGIRSTSTILFGHIENESHILNHLRVLKEIQEETGGFTEFVPLLFIPFKTPLSKTIPDALPLEKTLRIYAISRLFLGGVIRNIQASWVKLGHEGAIAALSAGANDLGGTLFEENITSSAGGNNPQGLSESSIRDLIAKAGRTARQRDTLYNFL